MKSTILWMLLLSISGLSSINAQIPVNGLIAYYSFIGNAHDESGYGNHGTVNGATLTSDRFGNANCAYFFDGLDDRITVPNNDLIDFSNEEDFTIAFWMKSTGTNWASIINKQYPGYWNGYILSLNNGDSGYCTEEGHIMFYVAAGAQEDACSDHVLNNGEWVFVTGIYCSRTNIVKLYINGIFQSDMGQASGEINTTQDLLIGYGYGSGSVTYFYEGSLDDIRIYNRILSDQEVLALYHEGEINPDSGLIAYYPFNGNAHDESGYGNHGTVNGATLTTDRFGNVNCAYNFDGINDFIEIQRFSSIPAGNQSRTVALWIYTLPDSWGTDVHTVFEYGDDIPYQTFGIDMSCYPVIQFYSWDHDIYCYTNAPQEGWLFLTFTHDGETMRVYINGNLIESLDLVLQTTLTNIFVGCDDPISLYYLGKIDDICLYDRALNQQEIMALYNENYLSGPTITVGSTSTALVGSNVEIPILTSDLDAADNIISYQFRLTYDDSFLEYLEYNLEGTIAEGGTVFVNSETAGQLIIGYLNSTALTGSGSIIDLRFSVTGQGYSPVMVSEFLFNTDPVANITNGFISTPVYGDVDANSYVQAYDAALALQYSVGLDPLPSIDPLPWETWRIATTDVDGVSGITAFDASLILQKVVGLISQFPIESTHKNTQINNADIELKIENNAIVFYSKGMLFGLNVNADNSSNILGLPVLMDNSTITAFNDQNNSYAIGIATTYSIADNTALIKIPINKDGRVTFNMIVNNVFKTMTLDIPFGDLQTLDERTVIFPNPAKEVLIIEGIISPTDADIYTMDGKLIRTYTLNSPTSEIDIDNLSFGVYMIKLQEDDEIAVKRFVKQ